MPAAAHMARRPFLISLRAKSLAVAGVLPKFSGLKPKSPGARSPDFLPSVMAMPPKTFKRKREKRNKRLSRQVRRTSGKGITFKNAEEYNSGENRSWVSVQAGPEEFYLVLAGGL